MIREWILTLSCSLCQNRVDHVVLPANFMKPFPVGWKKLSSGWSCHRHDKWIKELEK